MEINEIIHIYSKSLSGKVVNELFQKVTEIEFNPTIHYPLICLHIHYSMLEKAEHLMNICSC